MIVLDGQRVCATCKPVAIQRLKEGVPVRPEGRVMSVGEFLTASWRAFCADWRTISLLALLVAIPKSAILLPVDPGTQPSVLEFIRYMNIAQLVEILMGIFSGLGIARIVDERLQGRSTSLRGALAHAFHRWRSGVWTGFLSSMITGVLLLAFIIPGIIWLGYYTFSTSVVSLRDRSGKSALDDSKALVKGRWWTVVGRIAVIGVPTIMAGAALGMTSSFAPELRFLSFASWVISDALFAFASVATTVLFLNLECAGPRFAPVR
jgi:hypothetical protein